MTLEARLLILGALFFALVAAIAYWVVSVVRSRRSSFDATLAPYRVAEDEADAGPLVTGDWHPAESEAVSEVALPPLTVIPAGTVQGEKPEAPSTSQLRPSGVSPTPKPPVAPAPASPAAAPAPVTVTQHPAPAPAVPPPATVAPAPPRRPAAPPAPPAAAAKPIKPAVGSPQPAPVQSPAPRAPVVRDAPAYTPVAPVELRFDDDAPPVGVKAGTRTYVEFRRAADALFSELARVRDL